MQVYVGGRWQDAGTTRHSWESFTGSSYSIRFEESADPREPITYDHYTGPFGHAIGADEHGTAYEYLMMPDGTQLRWDMQFCEFLPVVVTPTKDTDPSDQSPALEGDIMLGDWTRTTVPKEFEPWKHPY